MKSSTILSCFLLFVAISIKAQWTSDTMQNTLVRDIANATSPLVAQGLNGSTYISWFEKNGTNFDLRMQLLDSNGYKLWSPNGIVVSNFPQDSILYHYDLKTDFDGNAIVAFQDIRSGALKVVAYKIDPNGNYFWGPSGISLIDSSSQKGFKPSIGITSQNDIVIAWSDDSASSKWISAQRLSPTGEFLWNKIYRIKEVGANLNFSHPELFPSGSDDMQMLFVQENGSFPSITYTLYTQRILLAGNNFWPSAINVSTKALSFYNYPQLIPDDNGGFYLAFNASNAIDSSLIDVYVQYIDYNGILWNATGVVADNSPLTNKIAASSYYLSFTSEFWVVLQVLDSSQESSGLSIQKFDAYGNFLLGANALVIIPFDTLFFIPNTINYTNDGMILTITYGDSDLQHIKAIKLDNDGIPLWANTSVSISAVNSNKENVQSGEYFNNNLVIVWQDNRNGSGIFAQNITGNGNRGIVSGISNNLNENNILFFPNPSNDPQIIFSAISKSKCVINVCDLRGKELLSMNVPSNTTFVSLNNFENLSKGIYFVNVKNLEDSLIFKWVKQ